MKIPLGQILVQSGIITVKTLERALTRQEGSGKRLGAILDEMGVITPEELVEALAQQSGMEMVKRIAVQNVPGELLELVPGEVAINKLVFPLKRQGGVLAIAVSDPIDSETLDLLERHSCNKIVQVLAAREEILGAIKQHYLRNQAADNVSLKILLVDDSAGISCDVEGALKNEGYQVYTARDGVEGLKIAFSQRPDLILCDAGAPKMDGYALMRAIKANPASAGTPMILLTSKASPEEEHRALKAGFHDFIAKPMMTIRVVSRVKRAFQILDKGKEQQAVATL
ncbi:response regulator, GspIIEN domain-containing [Citrifermentans bemidjiense Bem]|uniref:Response regulator, GspIIEN domain-containing n=1 Tax=Citrifermentans bemidjiense (strain ATCC BAA-1014 / DSM 16622 / JCM 12645 / Bem) TaxID=404380 RepID=B5E8W5_CITBB|nr:response regulator [Citrifermentans bemidjiense]ACH40129.1 response regulator, GspIIEN domain-containing [Citrifermentans bemidjiense Bem]